MATLKTSLEQQEQLAADRANEVDTLRHCLLQVTEDEKEQVDYEDVEGGAKEGSNGELGEEDEEEKAAKKNAQLMRIEALLNTTKVRAYYTYSSMHALLLLWVVVVVFLLLMFFVFVFLCFVLPNVLVGLVFFLSSTIDQFFCLTGVCL